MAVLRITLSLIVVLCFAVPAAAQQFDTTLLQGTWTIQGAETAADSGGAGGWILGTVFFDDEGNVIAGSVVNDRGDQTLLEIGRLVVTSQGAISGTIGSTETGVSIDVRGRVLPDRQTIVAVTSSDEDPAIHSLVILTRTVSVELPLFSQADVTGTWRSSSLLIPGLPAVQSETLDGTLTYDSEGDISSGTLRVSEGAQTSAVTGNMFVVANGALGGSLQINLGQVVDVSTFSGYMSRDKSLMVGITTRTQPGSTVVVQNGIWVLQRQATGQFTTADLAGPWDLFSLQSRDTQGNVGQWITGNLAVRASDGLVTGALTGPGLEEDVVVDLGDVAANHLSVSPTGEVTGTIVTELRSLSLRGTMNTDKTRVVGVDVLDEDAVYLGFFTLLKSNAPPPAASTVQFRATTTALRVTEGGTATVIVDRSGATTTQVTVDYQVTGGSATLGSDFTVASGNLTSATGTLTFAPGETSKTINVVALTDSLVEADETVNLTLSDPTNGAALGARSSATVTIGNSAAVQFQQAIYTAKENVASLVVTAVRTGSSTTPFTVTYTAIPISAELGVDFKLPPSTVLTFAAGVLSRTFTVTILNNTALTGNRSFTLALGTPTNGVQLGTPASTTVTIAEQNQPGSIKLDKTAYTVAESAGTLAIIVRRTGTNLAGGVTVDYVCDGLTASDEGSRPDYACPLVPGTQGRTLTFKAAETMKTVSIPIFKDTLVDGPKTLNFRLVNPSSGAEILADQSSALITINDVDLPGVIKFVPDKVSVNEGVATGQVTLKVQRTGGLGGGVLVDFTTVAGTAIGGREGQGDYEITSGTLSFGFGNTSTTITIPIRQDTLAEGNETFTIVLSNARTAAGPLPLVRPVGGRLPVVLPTPGSTATVTIVDDESAFQFSAASFNVKEGTANGVVTVLRTGTLTGPAAVDYTAAPGTAQPDVDFTPVSATLSFPANVASKTFNVPILNNTRLDGPRTVALTLGETTGGAQLGTQRTATLTIEDNEQAGTFKLDKGTYTVLESAGSVSVTVMRTGLNLTGNVSVNLVATDGTAKNGVNYTAPPATVTFGFGETSKIVKISILRDLVVTGVQNFTLGLSDPSSGATVGTPGTATVNITEADVAGSVKFSASTYAVNESAGQAVITLTRTGGAAGGVVVQVTTQDGTASAEGGDYSPVSQLVTFPAGNTSTTVRIPIRSDVAPEEDKSFLVKLSRPDPNPSGVVIGAPSTATVTIMDDDESIVRFNGNFIGNFPVLERDGNLKRVVTVEFDSDDGTAIGGIDFTPVRGTITFAANTKTTTIPLAIFNDTIAEGRETFTYFLTNPRGARLDPEASQKTFIITDNDFGGNNIGFTVPTFSGNEGQTVTLTLNRTGGLGSSLEVPWSAGEGSATAGVDFTPASGVVTFAANSLTASFTITLLTDSFPEGTETVPITLGTPDATATLDPERSTATVQIQDTAPPASVVQFTSSTFAVPYGQDAEITLTRSGALGTTLVVNWTRTGGTAVAGEDFSPSSGQVTFGPNDTTASFTVSTRESGGGDPDVTVVFGLSVASGTATIGAVNAATLTIVGASAELNLDLSVYSVVEGGGPALITVTRRGNIDRQVSVNFATSNGTAVAGTHYTARSGALTLPVGARTATFTVPILSNGPGDGTRTVSLTLSNPSPNTVLGEGDTARLEIRESPAYTFTLIAQTDNDEIVSFDGTPGINDAGRVAFKALAVESQRVFTGNGGALTEIASLGTEGIAEFGSRFSIDNSGNVAFVATLESEQRAIFRGDDESLDTIATTNNQMVDLFDPAMSSNGNMVFAGLFADVQTGTTIRLIRRTGITTGPVPGTDGSLFVNIGTQPSVNDNGVVAFVANSEPGRGIYSVDAGGASVAEAEDVDVATFTNVSLNNAGRVAFIPGSGNIRQSVLLSDGDGGVVAFATAANGFQNFGLVGAPDSSPVINDRGDVAFWALTQAGNEGILTGANPATSMAIQVGDPLFGSNVTSLTFGGINAPGRIVFRATLLDGREVVAVAAPPAVASDLAVTKTVNNPTPAVGGTVTFTVTARNNGPAAAAGVVVTDLLPASLTFVSATPQQGTYNPGAGVWTVGTLAANAAQTLQITATVTTGNPVINSASISAPGVTDPNVANNSASATVTPAQQTDIAITKTANTPNPVIGSNVIFTVTATNNGPVAATNVQVTDLLPTGFTFVSALASQGTYTSGTGVWAVSSLGVSANATLQITASVRPSGVYSNTATRTASTPADTNAANDSATATVSPISGIALTTDGSLVGLGRTINGTAAIPTPAPAGGVTVTLASNPTGLVNLSASTLTIAQGQTSVPFTITGAGVGTTTISATATGFGPGSVSVTVTNSVISLGALPALGPGQTTSLPISLSTAAPASGLTVTFSSTNTNAATVTPSVFIPGGSQVPAANPQVTAVGVGSAQINATAIGFAPDSRAASVTVNVTFTPTFLSVVVGTSSNITVNIGAPAPSNGLTLALATANTNVATVASSVTIPAGQLSVQTPVTGVTAGQSTTLQATGTSVTSATATINVVQPPVINFNPANPTLGRNLELQASVSLGAAAPAGGVQLTVASADPARLLVSTSGTAQGSGQVVLPVNAGSASSATPLFIQALDGTGTAQLNVTAPGYAPRAITVTFAPSGFVINPFQLGNFTTTTFAANQTVQLLPAQLNPTNLQFVTNQLLRGGLGPVNVTVTATDQPGGGSTVGTIVGNPAVFVGGDNVKSVAFDPAAAGTSLIEVVTPTGFNFSTPSTARAVTATVTAPTINVNNQFVGRDLQIQGQVSLNTPAPTGGIQLTLTSADPARMVLTTSQTATGIGQITLNFPAGASSPNTAFFIQALDGTGTVQLNAAAPGYTPQSATITLAPSGFVINPFQLGNFTTTTFSGNQPVQIVPAALNATSLAFVANQAMRAGMATVTVPVTAMDQPTGGSSVATIVGSPVTFNPTDTVKTVQFDPLAAGISLIQVGTPTGFSTPSNSRSVTATVTAPVLVLSNQTVGRDLQVFGNLSLGAPAPTGGTQVTVTSADPARVVVSTSPTAQGTGQVTIPFNAGATTSSTQLWIQALSATGTVQVTASAPGFVSQAATITLGPSGFVINPFQINNFTTTTFSNPTVIQVIPALLNASLNFSQNQAIRGGLAGLNVPVTATDQPTGGSTVGTIVGSPAVFNGNDTTKNLLFDPAAAGTSLIQVNPPAGSNFSTPANARTITATVTAPAITFSSTTLAVGQNLQQALSIFLGATPPSPVTVTVTVASTAVATIIGNANATLEGSTTVTFTNVTSTSAGTIVVQGRAASGTTSITAQAPGFADGVMTVTAQPSGFILNAGNFTTTASANPSNITISAARLNPTTLNLEAVQNVRGGFTVDVPVTATDQTGTNVGTITTSPVRFTANQSSLNTQFNPNAAGTSVVTVGVPSGFSTPSNSRQITVTVNP